MSETEWYGTLSAGSYPGDPDWTVFEWTDEGYIQGVGSWGFHDSPRPGRPRKKHPVGFQVPKPGVVGSQVCRAPEDGISSKPTSRKKAKPSGSKSGSKRKPS